jgi:hypothetical protein
MNAAPDEIDVARHRDLQGRDHEPWMRRALVALVVAIPILALLNLFGQRPSTSRAATAAASVKVYAPARVRSGILYEARFHVVARRELKEATLVLSPGWAESMTINTIEPAPVSEASRNGNLSLVLGHIPAGDSHLLFMQFQVNPTNVGRRPQVVQLYDGDTLLLTLDRTITIFP